MKIEILGADSLGVRSLATFVRTRSENILIDPGVSVCPKRFGLPPHHMELEALRKVRRVIIDRAKEAHAIVITHFHHDHFTSFEERALDLTDAETARSIYRQIPIFAKSWRKHLNRAQRKRALTFLRNLRRRVTIADGKSIGNLIFSPPFKHGEKSSPQGYLIMVGIMDGDQLLIYASDIQLIEPEAVRWISTKKPEIVIVSGPPIYLSQLSKQTIKRAQDHLIGLAQEIPTIIIDHHLMRSLDYEIFLSRPREVAARCNHHIFSASEFMQMPEQLLEARRAELWGSSSIPGHQF